MKGFRVKNTHRKKCALVAVNELISYGNDNSNYFYNVDYWQDVKDEINAL